MDADIPGIEVHRSWANNASVVLEAIWAAEKTIEHARCHASVFSDAALLLARARETVKKQRAAWRRSVATAEAEIARRRQAMNP